MPVMVQILLVIETLNHDEHNECSTLVLYECSQTDFPGVNPPSICEDLMRPHRLIEDMPSACVSLS